MPELVTTRFERFVPDIGNNRQEASPFFLEVASNLPLPEMDALEQRLRSLSQFNPSDESQFIQGVLGALGDTVKMGTEPLTVNGEAITDLAGYIALSLRVSGLGPLWELFRAVRTYNSVEGVRALFYERSSGGTVFTGSRKTGANADQMAAR